MIVKFGILFLVCYVSRASAHPPCACARNYLPVCGSDGKTYANTCLLDCARATNSALTKVKNGDCEDIPPSTCACTFEYKPVCGSDGETYPNQCTLRCQTARNPGVQLKHTGPCKSSAVKAAEPCVCTREMKPVCGTDGETYASPCMLNCKAQTKSGLDLKHLGPCVEVKVAEEALPASCACTRNLQPVCGTDGVTYNNPCLLECAARSKPLTMKSVGPCGSNTVEGERAEPSSCVCARNYFPVCGSDGHTYPSPCMLGCATHDKPALRLTHPGPCGEEFQVNVVEEA